MAATSQTLVYRRRTKRRLPFGGIFQLEGWDYVHETFNDYPDSPNEGIDGSQLDKAVGWVGAAQVLEIQYVNPIAGDSTDSGYTHNTSINGLGGGEGWEGTWTVG